MQSGLELTLAKDKVRPFLATLLCWGIFSLVGCFFGSAVVPVPLSPPTVLPAVAARPDLPVASRSISLVRTTDTSSNQSIHTNTYVQGFVPFLVTTKTNFVADAPAPWVENAFAASLEKGGYEIKRADSVVGADRRTILIVSVTELSADIPSGIHFSLKGHCDGKIGVKIILIRDNARLIDRDYEGSSEVDGHCFDLSILSSAAKAALEDLLAKAIPEINEKLTQ